MRLYDILKNCGPFDAARPQDQEISAIACDSRQAGPGSLFFAIQGHAADGHAYIGQALDQGAAAVVAQRIPDGLSSKAAAKVILNRDTRKALALAAATFHGRPADDLVMVAITGTNGKTTSSWILESIFTAAGFKVGVMGTVNIRYGDVIEDAPITTPDPISIQYHLAKMKAAGVTHVIMEVSSHSLAQYRVLGCEFDAAIFTNLTQDHLDYHPTLEDYFLCKKTLFTAYLNAKHGTAIVNTDDEYGRRLADEVHTDLLTTAVAGPADIRADDIQDEITGLCAQVNLKGERVQIASSLTGRFNLENLLGAAGAALALNISTTAIVEGIANLGRVPGRLEKLDTALNRHIFVDYAHTPDALASILETLSQRAPARIITVFGCGGDRDRTKRAPMGKIACKYSDIAIATSDNPRTEDPDAIVADIIKGIKEDGVTELDRDHLTVGETGYIKEVDRAKALALAVKISRPEDIIVAAGKGHETYQITNTGTIHFDDMEHLSNACNRLITPYDWTVSDLNAALGTAPSYPVADTHKRFKTIGTDSRTIDADMVFVALAGEHFDAHTFIPELLTKGIQAFVVRNGFLNETDDKTNSLLRKNQAAVFEVTDTQAALGKLAHYQRHRANVKLLAITGSNGKTTTRKMARDIFAQTFDVLATQGNFNNEIGMPLTLLGLAPTHEWAVVEMGMNHPGEISRLTAIAQPDIALITNTSGAHLEGLKTAENVARAKSEIFEGLREHGTAIVFKDDPRWEIMANAARNTKHAQSLQCFGQTQEADIRATQIQTDGSGTRFSIEIDGESHIFKISSPARFMVNNATAAAGAALAAGIDVKAIQRGLAAFTPVKGRMQVSRLSCGTSLIDDTYNANPASMTQALKTLNQLAGPGRGLAALGDMLELGAQSDTLHREIGHLIAKLAPAMVCLYGTQTAHIRSGALEKGYPEKRLFTGTKAQIAAVLAPKLSTDNWLLLKGSRGMAMETLIPEIEVLIRKERKADTPHVL
ncbi:MAG: UDP-N-acetylmuramoyl-L-alanyl-D-glutamate--2,6-diaminopimelate ligase [Desulfobacterales bacterium]|nr:MAG: UDP-N-acetylmuramoyl-L-alanyl-D-glutamate--2,6-diaminopimelate ligase [Desulfobacterales bacterium]